jgi:predicted metal-dependent HD superfamily phosphohydrolase
MSVTLSSWRKTWQELGASVVADELFHKVIACYSERHRHYHTLQHLRECLENFDTVRTSAQHPAEIELGLWFHDIVYDPRRDDNELRSAEWARTALSEHGASAEIGERVYELIMATRHDAPPQGADTALLVDVDLSILGAERARFDESNEQIRAEYAHVPEVDYRQGRRRILNSFLARPRLYSTEHFYRELEVRARENLARALARLAN